MEPVVQAMTDPGSQEYFSPTHSAEDKRRVFQRAGNCVEKNEDKSIETIQEEKTNELKNLKDKSEAAPSVVETKVPEEKVDAKPVLEKKEKEGEETNQFTESDKDEVWFGSKCVIHTFRF